MSWTVEFVSRKARSETLALPPGLLARVIRYAEAMEKFGPDLGMPHTRALGRGLFELRVKASEGIARVFFCTTADRRIVFLHVLVKKSQRTPGRDLDVARRRMKELKGV